MLILSPWSKNSPGFTLIEILVAISIMAIVGTIALPGLRNFADRQQLNNATNQLYTALSLAKTNAQNKVICANSGQITSAWQINFVSSNTLSLRALCPNPNDQITYTLPGINIQVSANQGIFTTICINNTYISFTNSTGQVALYCNNSLVPAPTPLSLVLSLQSNPAVTKSITINQGGILIEN